MKFLCVIPSSNRGISCWLVYINQDSLWVSHINSPQVHDLVTQFSNANMTITRISHLGVMVTHSNNKSLLRSPRVGNHCNYHGNRICLVNCHRSACSVLCVGVVITVVTVSV
jgi:hypothetical protein